MQAILDFLSGKKTYLLMLAAIFTAIAGLANGDITIVQTIEAVFAAVGGMTIRAAITKSGPTP